MYSIQRPSERVMVCFHGSGDSYEIANQLDKVSCITSTLVSFNFPEHHLKDKRVKGVYDYRKASFGTINELMPALFVLKEVVVNQGCRSIDLYGFSAGGGVLINVIKILKSSTYDNILQQYGVDVSDKEQIFHAIQRGTIVLDTPLKSIEEIIDYRGFSDEMEHLAANYRLNGFRPIDSIHSLKGEQLKIILHFQVNDEILSNRDDALFIERMIEVQPSTVISIGEDGGHLSYHRSLWETYSKEN